MSNPIFQQLARGLRHGNGSASRFAGYARFTLSYRDVKDLLAERGLDASYGHRHVWTYMDPARLQPGLANSGPRSQLLTYIRLRYAA